MPIHILSEIVVAQIAAGEVVERPASVVKELLENAIDAGATNIRIEITGGGRQRIRISDDGSGIPPHEVELAFQRHATSKLLSADDLSSIETLGFRGEALASIASVSQLSMITRNMESEAGIYIQLAGSEILRKQTVGAPVGTVITVENLFYNTPARLKFLKKENTEKRQIALFVSRYAMAYPHVRFVLEQDGREVFRSSGSGQLADVIVAAMGLDSFKNMVEIKGHDAQGGSRPEISVTGFSSVPSLHRADRNHITLFVNGRWIQDTRLSYAITQAYHTFLMTGRYPVAIVMVQIPPTEVDVNVHPTKAEVRFRDPEALFSAVQRAVRRSVVELAQTPAMRSGRFGGLGYTPNDWQTWEASPTATAQRQLGMELDLHSAGQYTRTPLKQESYRPAADEIPEGIGAPAKPRTLPILRVIGQIGATYIVAEGPSGLYLIDQHAAHERILYEQFMDEHARHEQVAQLSLDAQTITLPSADAHLIEDNLQVLGEVGFTLEPFGPNTFIIRGVPALLANQAPDEVLAGIIADLEAGTSPGHSSIEEKIVTRVCKHGAIKAGQILSADEMQSIIRQLERCKSPHTCPHGRPTMLHMTSEQLAKEFGRLG
ncbi:MAG: DNA mismatch repair endonuclease MutL [Chloroflexi bacterium]|nr:DNA mismatch repair endonuclease MutL [Chloroflexota bacterium]MCC6891345.1 DNA mismatch repair endonuclease MutL [Anaerolineae bacterium]